MNSQERDTLVTLLDDYIRELRHLTTNKDLPPHLFANLQREIEMSLGSLDFKDQKGKITNCGQQWTKISQGFSAKNTYDVSGLQQLLIDFLRETAQQLRLIPVSSIETQGEVPQQMKELVKQHEVAKRKREQQEEIYQKWRGRWRQWHELQLKNKEPDALAVYHLLNELVQEDPAVAKNLSFVRAKESALGKKPKIVSSQQAFVPLAELVLRSSDTVMDSSRKMGTVGTKPDQKIPQAIRDATANQVLKNLEERYGLVLQGTSPDNKQAAKEAAKKEIGRIMEMAYGVTGARRQTSDFTGTNRSPDTSGNDRKNSGVIPIESSTPSLGPSEDVQFRTADTSTSTDVGATITLVDPNNPNGFVLELPRDEVLATKYREQLAEITTVAEQEANYEAAQKAIEFSQIETAIDKFVSESPSEIKAQLEERLLRVVAGQNESLEAAFLAMEKEVAKFNQSPTTSRLKGTTIYDAGSQVPPTTSNIPQPNLQMLLENFERSSESSAFVQDLAHELRLQRLLAQNGDASPLALVHDIEKLLVQKGISPPQITLFLSTGLVTGEMSAKLTPQDMMVVLRFAEIKQSFDERMSLVFKKHGVHLGDKEKRLVLHDLFYETTGVVVPPTPPTPSPATGTTINKNLSHHSATITGNVSFTPSKPSTTHDDGRHFSGSPFLNAFSKLKNLLLDRFPFLNPISRFFSGITNRFLSALMNTRWLSGLISRALGSQLFGGLTRFALGRMATAGISAAGSLLGLGTGTAAAGTTAGVTGAAVAGTGAAAGGAAAVAGGATAETAAGGGLAALLFNPVTGAPTALGLAVLVFITVIVLVFFFNGVDQNMQQALLPTTGDVAIPPVNIASGTCPVDGQVRFLRGVYDGAGGTGHGSDDYWTDIGRTPFSYPIPVIHPTCNTPNTPPQCPAGYYGLAIDIASVPMASVPVYVPYVCQTGNCTAPFMTWTVERRTSTTAGDGLILTSADNGSGQNWKIYLLHLDPNSIPAKTTFTTQQGDNYVGNMFVQGTNGNNTHVHFEVKLGDVPTDPTPFCDGSAGGPPQTGQCVLPQSGLCSVNDPVTRFSASDVFGAEAPNFSYLCYRESRGYALALNDNCLRASDGVNNEITDDQVSYNDDGPGCVDLQDTVANGCPEPEYDGATEDYSVGLFQINQAPTTGRCPAAWENPHTDYVRYGGTLPNVYCKIRDASELAKCVEPLLDPVTNTMRTREMSGGGVDYTPWRTPNNPSGNPMCK